MSGGIKDLYHPTILEHNKHPVHFEIWEAAPHIIEAYNPVCGDQFKIYLAVKNNRIERITFHGYGCALSKSATSVLVQLLQDKSLEDAKTICSKYFEALEQGVIKTDDPQEFEAFLAVKKFPEREQCVNLSWKATQSFLNQ